MPNRLNAIIGPSPIGNSIIMPPLLLLGRLLLCAIFLHSGYGKILDFGGTRSFMESQGLTTATGLLLVLAIFAEMAGGLSLLLGFMARIGGAGLVVFLIPATLLFHAFWKVPAEEQHLQLIMFMKNAGLAGGLLYVTAIGAGPWSVDGLIRKRAG